MVGFREKLLLAALIFTFLNILIFIALFQFSDAFRASGTTFAGMILGNLTIIVGGLAGYSYAKSESGGNRDDERGRK